MLQQKLVLYIKGAMSAILVSLVKKKKKKKEETFGYQWNLKIMRMAADANALQLQNFGQFFQAVPLCLGKLIMVYSFF